jgi:hypothetical protein
MVFLGAQYAYEIMTAVNKNVLLKTFYGTIVGHHRSELF